MNRTLMRDYVYVLRMAKKIRAICLLGEKCCICGDDNIFHLTFHHIDRMQKEYNVSAILEKRWQDIEGEIKKCELLCYNCHQEMHFPSDSDVKNKLLDIKGLHRCSECGYSGKSNSSLSFHHIEKNRNNQWLSEKCNYTRGEIGMSTEEIVLEMDKCIVLCENCHQQRHANIDRFNALKERVYKKITTYREKRKNISVSEREKIKQMANSGMSILKISKIMHCGTDTIRENIRKEDNCNNYLNRTNEKQILDMRKNGNSIGEISDAIKVTKKTVKKYLKKNNFKGRAILNYDQIVLLKKYGKKNSDIAKEVGCHLTTVSRILSRSSYVRSIKKENKTKEIDIVNMYKNGESVRTIMNKFGYSDVTIYRIIKRNGVTVPSRRVDTQKILDLRKRGENLDNISKLARCSRDSVYRTLKKYHS